MHKLKLNNNKEVVREIQSYFKKLPDGDFIHRLNAVLLIAHDWDCSSIAKLYKKSIRTIHSRVHTVNQHGIEALKTSHRPGRTSGLTEPDKEQLKQDLQLSPEIYGYNQAAWNGILLSKYLQERYGVSLKPRRRQYLFHELGFSLKRPRKIPAQASEQAQEAFKKTR